MIFFATIFINLPLRPVLKYIHSYTYIHFRIIIQKNHFEQKRTKKQEKQQKTQKNIEKTRKNQENPNFRIYEKKVKETHCPPDQS